MLRADRSRPRSSRIALRILSSRCVRRTRRFGTPDHKNPGRFCVESVAASVRNIAQDRHQWILNPLERSINVDHLVDVLRN